MSNPHDQEEKPSLIAKIIVGVAWLVLFSSAAVFVLGTAQPKLIDKATRSISGR